MDSAKCSNCTGYCPSGTLENGLCSFCNLIGTKVLVSGWGRWGMQSCLVTRVSRNGNVYAKRWFKSRGRWSKERRIDYYKGWRLANS